VASQISGWRVPWRGTPRWRRFALSLNERERRCLSRIAEELAASAPALVTLLTFFNRLASGEEMPKRRPLRRLRRRISTGMATGIFMGVWAFMTVAMITVALVLSHVGHGAEAGAMLVVSGHSR
jgi:hypothetical protein